jgi:hypothetical protein
MNELIMQVLYEHITGRNSIIFKNTDFKSPKYTYYSYIPLYNNNVIKKKKKLICLFS